MTFPIILAHGIARFDAARELLDDDDGVDDGTHYFRRIRSTLLAEGFNVHHSSVSFAGSVDVRSRQLKENVERVLHEAGASKVHIIAHSMGGLDARHMLFDHQDERIHERVASLTTIGTPHLGTSFADWSICHTDKLFTLFDIFGIHALDVFKDLTTAACREFNASARSFESSCGVTFQTYAGTQALPFIFTPLQFSWCVIQQNEGANDGLVSLASARWRDEFFQREIRADHLNQIGWWDTNELALCFFPSVRETRVSRLELEQRIRALYVEIAQELV